MYRCDVCGSVVSANVPCNRITVETRWIRHPHREKVHWHPPSWPHTKGTWVDDHGGVGHAIVREVNACASCAAEIRGAVGETTATTRVHSDAEKPPPGRLAA